VFWWLPLPLPSCFRPVAGCHQTRSDLIERTPRHSQINETNQPPKKADSSTRLYVCVCVCLSSVCEYGPDKSPNVKNKTKTTRKQNKSNEMTDKIAWDAGRESSIQHPSSIRPGGGGMIDFKRRDFGVICLRQRTPVEAITSIVTSGGDPSPI